MNRRTTRSLRSARAAALLLALSFGLVALALAERVGKRPARERAATRVAITFDDLPASKSLPAGYGADRVLAEIVASLRAHRVSEVTGFVIGERVEQHPTGLEALRLFRAAGHRLGNHTHSHPALSTISHARYLADVARLDPLLRALESSGGELPFRYPFLEEGRTPEERRELTRELGQLGYRSAPVTIDFFDWSYADPYGHCLGAGESEALAALERRYLAQAEAALAWSEHASEQLLGRSLPHVLILHANVATARTLDALLTRYEQAGVRFVPLDEALSDPAYREAPEAGAHLLRTRAEASSETLSPSPVTPLVGPEERCPAAPRRLTERAIVSMFRPWLAP